VCPLCNSDSSSQPVSMLSEPKTLNSSIANRVGAFGEPECPNRDHTVASCSFANPRMTIQNQTGAPPHPRNPDLRQIKSVVNSIQAQSILGERRSANPAVPDTLTMNSPVVLKMDFNIDSSIQQSDLSINPTISLCSSQRRIPAAENQSDEDMELIGQVASMTKPSHFTIQRGMNGPSFTIATIEHKIRFRNVYAAPLLGCKRVKSSRWTPK